MSASQNRRITMHKQNPSRQGACHAKNIEPHAARRTFHVTESTSLLPFLREKLAPQSATTIKNLLKHECVIVNEHTSITRFDYPLNPGDTVSITSSREQRYGFHHPLLKLLFEDDFILIVEKGSGLHSVDSTAGGIDNTASILEKYIQKRSPSKRIYIVLRLDRDTSGVMIFAKSREAQNKLLADWNHTVLERCYIAVVEGCPVPETGTVDEMLYEDDHKIVRTTRDKTIGLPAVTHYQVLKKNAKFALVKLELETGRTNQIRVHMQSIGHPVVGDFKYKAAQDPLHRLGLHAKTIKFIHPITQKIMAFDVHEPKSFGQVFEEE